jgi:hypothetical protein
VDTPKTSEITEISVGVSPYVRKISDYGWCAFWMM